MPFMFVHVSESQTLSQYQCQVSSTLWASYGVRLFRSCTAAAAIRVRTKRSIGRDARSSERSVFGAEHIHLLIGSCYKYDRVLPRVLFPFGSCIAIPLCFYDAGGAAVGIMHAGRGLEGDDHCTNAVIVVTLIIPLCENYIVKIILRSITKDIRAMILVLSRPVIRGTKCGSAATAALVLHVPVRASSETGFE